MIAADIVQDGCRIWHDEIDVKQEGQRIVLVDVRNSREVVMGSVEEITILVEKLNAALYAAEMDKR